MKGYIKYILVGIATVLLAIACVEEGQFEKPVFANIKPYYLKVNADGVTKLGSSAGNTTISVESVETGWKITGMPDWVQLEPSSGNGSAQVKVIYKENLSTTANRSAVLTLASTDAFWNYSYAFTISQERSLCYADPVAATLTTTDGKAANLSMQLVTNTSEWQASALADLSGWATVSKGSDSRTVIISVQPNVGVVSRTGTVQVTTIDSKKTFTVTQRPAGITSSLTKLSYEVSGGSQSINVISDASWTAQTASSWIQVTPSTGTEGSVSVTVETLPNYSLSKRNGYVYLVLSDDNKMEIPVEQECVAFSLDRSSMAFAAGPSNDQLNVSSNVNWSVKDGYAEWLSFSPAQGTESAAVTVSAQDNNSTTERAGKFSVSPTVIDYAFTVDVSQAGHSFQADSTALEFSDKAGSAQVSVISDGTWVATTQNDWITLTPGSMTGNGTLAVAVTENTGVESRTGWIAINLGTTVVNVRVVQLGKYFTLSGNLFNFAAKGGQTQVDLTTNDGWTASAGSGQAWVSLSETSGDGDCSLIITVAENKSPTDRKDTVTINPTNLNSLSIIIEQAARYMNLPTSSIQFFDKGGTTDNIQVETDGLVQAVTTDDWLTISTLDNGLFTVTAQTNLTHFDRSGTVTVTMTDLTQGELVKTITVNQDKRTDDIIAIPDAAFKAVLLESGFDLDGDQDISYDEALLIKAIYASGKGITSLSSIEYMTALDSLDCSNNSLTELDLSSNASINYLNVKGNDALKRVDVWSTFSKDMFDAAQYDRQTYFVPKGNAQTFTVGGVSFTMITVPGGTFSMGATAEQGADANDAEQPAHSVTLTTFSIGQTEVTQALWKAVMGSNPSEIVGDDKPVSQLSWTMSRTFIQKLNEMTGLQFRFATEAEWEFAARGGNWSKGYKYSGGNDMDSVGWYKLNRGSHFFHDVATAYPNELGIYDMSGNLIEWCMDWDGVYTDAAQTDPTGIAAGEKHILRGGSWNDDAVNCRVSSRASAKDQQYQDIGLRLVLGGADVPDSWYGQWIAIPDESFSEELLYGYDTDADGHMSISELQAITIINIANYEDVADLTGIEYMTNLTQLFCNGNVLTSLNLSNNVKLKALVCANNQLTTLDISKNTALTTLNATGNPGLTTIYVWEGFAAADYPNFKIPSGAQYVVKK